MKTDVDTFIEYNFRDVEILKVLDEKLEYLSLSKNLAHKGKHNYSEVYANTKTQDGAISAYLLSQDIVPPPKDKNPIHKKELCWWLSYFAPKQVSTIICLMRI